MTKKILLVENSQEARDLARLSLQANGFDVVAVNDAQEALNRLPETKPDVIVVNVTLPQMDGYKLCKELRNNIITQTIPIIMLSGIMVGEQEAEKVLKLGANRFLTKPFRVSELTRNILELLAETKEEVLRRLKMLDEKTDGEIDTYKKTVRFMDKLFSDFSEGKEIDTGEIKKIATVLVETFVNNPNVLFNLTGSYIIDTPAALHSVNVSLISLRIGQCLGYTKTFLINLGLNALVHELVEQYKWDADSLYSAEMKSQPKKKILEIIKPVNEFESLIHQHLTHSSLAPTVALKRLLDSPTGSYNTEILKHLTTQITPYPLGGFVKLNTGEIGRVIKINSHNPFRPCIDLVRDRSNNLILEPKEIDLSQDFSGFLFRNVSEEEVYCQVVKLGPGG